MTNKCRIQPPVLELSMLLVDVSTISAAARDLVQEVVDDLDVDDSAVSDRYWQPIRCEVEVHPSGVITVLRSSGCTPNDVVDVCRVVGGGEVPVHDRTADTDEDISCISEDDR
jgi:hypothetical protein